MEFSQAIFTRYQDLQRYVDWTPADEARITAAAHVVTPHFSSLIDDFYAEIELHPAARRVITGGALQIERLKQTLRLWLVELFAGPYDEHYVARRWRVGLRHVEIGLPQVYTVVALSRLRNGMIRILRAHFRDDQNSLSESVQSLNKLLDLDLAIIGDAYETDYVERQQQAERQRLHSVVEDAQHRAMQAERLAAIGQMATGLAHESRNALQRIGASAEMLELEIEGNDQALQLVSRIQQSKDHLHQLLEEVRSYAAPIILDRSPCRLSEIWREAWQLLHEQRQSRKVKLDERIRAKEIVVNADRFRLVQVFRNLLENSLAACQDPVRIEVLCEDTALGSAPAIQVSVTDNGTGMNAEQRRRIFEPFYTTKPTGTGLGMAIGQRIIEAHGGTITVGDVGPPGAQIVITLPRPQVPPR
jgi:signal transduction histidine kinase